ncbi:mRNA 3'-end-processing protein rna14 [Paramarasmius palmivorus]|uniref:mRNA 3'-end-processing protein RNA14 n=1 Tax=Paramarasmius palmivorus TaxID=297713 RepID=A0AAW0CC65_9AGAR
MSENTVRSASKESATSLAPPSVSFNSAPPSLQDTRGSISAWKERVVSDQTILFNGDTRTIRAIYEVLRQSCATDTDAAFIHNFLHRDVACGDDEYVLEDILSVHVSQPELRSPLDHDVPPAEALESQRRFTRVNELYNGTISTFKEEIASFIESQSSMCELNTTNQESDTVSCEIERLRKNLGVVYILYLHFVRRSQGFNAARAIFESAKKDRSFISWEVYEAAALMEYRCSAIRPKEEAMKIFHQGMSLFGTNKDYVLQHLKFLISINDQNAHALFESVVRSNEFASADIKPVWDEWLSYQYEVGDSESIQRLQTRMALVYPNDTPVYPLTKLHRTPHLDEDNTRAIPATTPEVSYRASSIGTAKSAKRKHSGALDNQNPSGNDAHVSRNHSNKVQRVNLGPGLQRTSSSSTLSFGQRRNKSEGKFNRKDEQREPTVPKPLLDFLANLPASNSFEGPILDADGIMKLFKHTRIP